MHWLVHPMSWKAFNFLNIYMFKFYPQFISNSTWPLWFKQSFSCRWQWVETPHGLIFYLSYSFPKRKFYAFSRFLGFYSRGTIFFNYFKSQRLRWKRKKKCTETGYRFQQQSSFIPGDWYSFFLVCLSRTRLLRSTIHSYVNVSHATTTVPSAPASVYFRKAET